MADELKKILEGIREFGLESLGIFPGCYRATVQDNSDPEGLCRVKVKCPQIYGDAVTDWAWPKGQYAGKGYGSFIMPEEGDTVWVSFEQGLARYPIWEHGWWGQGEKPETASPKNKVFRTPSGNMVEYDDENNLIRITSAGGKVVEISDKISLGKSGGSAEPAVLGNKAADAFTAVNNALEGMAKLLLKWATLDATPSASLVPPLTGIGSTLLPELPQVLTDIQEAKQKIAEIKSQIVTLD